MLVFSDANPDPWRGPRRISPAHARAMWEAAGWNVDSIDESAVYADNIVSQAPRKAILMLATRR